MSEGVLCGREREAPMMRRQSQRRIGSSRARGRKNEYKKERRKERLTERGPTFLCLVASSSRPVSSFTRSGDEEGSLTVRFYSIPFYLNRCCCCWLLCARSILPRAPRFQSFHLLLTNNARATIPITSSNFRTNKASATILIVSPTY